MNTSARSPERKITAATLLQQFANDRDRQLNESCRVPMGSDPFLPQITAEQHRTRETVRAFALAAFYADQPATVALDSSGTMAVAELIEIAAFRQSTQPQSVGAIALQTQ
jgi:hypothetical protein